MKDDQNRLNNSVLATVVPDESKIGKDATLLTSEPASKAPNADAHKIQNTAVTGRRMFNQLQQHMNTLFTQPSSCSNRSTNLLVSRTTALATISQESPQNQQTLMTGLVSSLGKACFGGKESSPEKRSDVLSFIGQTQEEEKHPDLNGAKGVEVSCFGA